MIGRKVRLKLPTWPREYDGVIRRLHGPVLKEQGKGGKARFGRVYEVRSLALDALVFEDCRRPYPGFGMCF
jgi:hypothetical protein